MVATAVTTRNRASGSGAGRVAAVRLGAVAIVCSLSACGDAADDWGGIRNPLLSRPDVAVKDGYLVHDGATWHLGYSRITADPFHLRG